MRTIPIALQAHLESRRLTLAVLCKATRTDGEVFGFTDLDIDIPYGGVLYRAGALGFTMSAAEMSDELTADNHEVKGILSGNGITLFDILAGRWDSCDLVFSIVNYRSLGDGVLEEAFGTVGNIAIGTLSFITEFLDFKQKLDQNLLRVVSNMCDAILGDARCKVDLGPFTRTATVGASPTDRTFTDLTRTEPDGWWNGGNLTVLTGASAGLKMEIKKSTAAGAFELLLPLFFGLATGDTVSMTPGCNKQKRLADGTFGGDCVVKYDNAVNFRGFDAVPGTDKAISYVQQP